MNSKKVFSVLFLFIFGLLTNCSTPFGGIIGMTAQHVYETNSQKTINSNSIEKSAESCAYSGLLLLPFYGNGNSVEKARAIAGIKKIAVVDKSTTFILGGLIYQECTIVWGE